MIEVFHRNNHSFWCTSRIRVCSLLHPLKPKETGEEKHSWLQCASPKLPFSCKLAESPSGTYNESKGKNRKEQRRIILCCTCISSPGAWGPSSHQREVFYVWTLKWRNTILARMNFHSAKPKKCPRYVRASNTEGHRSMLENKLELMKRAFHPFQYLEYAYFLCFYCWCIKFCFRWF